MNFLRRLIQLIENRSRYRALIKDAEWQGRGDPDRYGFYCPWCGAQWPADGRAMGLHHGDCEAFTVDGAVRT